MSSQFAEKPKKIYWNGVKQVFKYLKGTINYSLVYGQASENSILIAYCDFDWVGDIDTRKNTIGWMLFERYS